MKGGAVTSPKRYVQIFFNFITQSRAEGLTWTEIERRLAQKGCQLSRGYLRVLYEKEEKRVSSPEQSQVIRWIYHNFEDISELVDDKVPWDLIIAIVPPSEEMSSVAWHISDLISCYTRVKEAMAQPGIDAAEKAKPMSKNSVSRNQGLESLFADAATNNQGEELE